MCTLQPHVCSAQISSQHSNTVIQKKTQVSASQHSKANNAGTDLLSILKDPKGIAAGGPGRSLEVLNDVLVLPGNSWSDMVHDMESEKKCRVLREG